MFEGLGFIGQAVRGVLLLIIGVGLIDLLWIG